VPCGAAPAHLIRIPLFSPSLLFGFEPLFVVRDERANLVCCAQQLEPLLLIERDRKAAHAVDDTTNNAIGRITTSGTITEYAIPTSGSSPNGITVGPDGNLWFTEGSSHKIGVIKL
jgi:sugar lactone lactonase YvrE